MSRDKNPPRVGTPASPAHPNWMPKSIPTSWDDLLEGIHSPEDWERRRQTIMGRFLALIRDHAAPSRPEKLALAIEKEWDTGDFRIQYVKKLSQNLK